MNAFPEFVSYLLKPTVEELWQRCRTFMRSEADWIATEVKNGVYSILSEIESQRPKQVRLLFIAKTIEPLKPARTPRDESMGNLDLTDPNLYQSPPRVIQSYGGAILNLKKDEEQAYQWFPQEEIGKDTVIICFGGQIAGAFIGNRKVDLSPPHGSCPMVVLPCSTQVGQAITLRITAD